jgi:chromosome segregation ATPase|tara:strand:- start:476 stop:727 length:252 start_codon:yes stop_codon:yes gene_type:complete
MNEIAVALITALTGSTAWSFYTRQQKNRFREREQLITELRQWRDDWKTRAEELDRKVQQLCVENGKLRAQIEKLETHIQHLTK